LEKKKPQNKKKKRMKKKGKKREGARTLLGMSYWVVPFEAIRLLGKKLALNCQ